jgi:hypothetical protein
MRRRILLGYFKLVEDFTAGVERILHQPSRGQWRDTVATLVAIAPPCMSYARLNNAPRRTNVYLGAPNHAPINRQAVYNALIFWLLLAPICCSNAGAKGAYVQ